MGLTQEIITQLVEKIKSVFNPLQIILFGSYAWGTPDKNSDLDLLVVIAHSDLSPSARASKVHVALSNFSFPTDIVVKTLGEYEKYKSVPASLEHRIFTKGRVLYG